MRVVKLDVERFLGFRSLSLEIDPTIQLLAGANNAGKSSVVRLLEAFFSDPNSEALQGMLPRNSYYKDLGARTLSSIQVWFGDLDADESERFTSALRRDGKFWVKLRCSRTGSISYEASRSVSAEEARRMHEEVLNRFHFVKIPSVRVAGEVNDSEPESLARLLDTLEAILVRTGTYRSTALQQQFRDRMEPLEALVKETLDQSAAAIVSELPFQENEVKFTLPDPRAALRGMLESAVIESAGDAAISVAERGTGFQSALVLGILRYVASKEAQRGANLMFAIEEPEAFLHPQTQRAMSKIVSDIAMDAQVLVTTHSSVMVDSFPIAQIARLPLQTNGVRHDWQTPKLDSTDAGRLSRYCSAANSELVFASAVIFVEGEGDYTAISKLLSRACAAPGGHYALGITVVEAGGLGKIQHLVHLANVFGISFYVLVDRDATRTTGGKRELIDILARRSPAPTEDERNQWVQRADKRSNSVTQSLSTQKSLNKTLDPHDIFVLSSDLEGLLVDSLGVEKMLEFLGPGGEGVMDPAFAKEIAEATNGEGYEKLARKLGSRGWNSDRKPSGKLEPHLVSPLLDLCLVEDASIPAALEPLIAWLDVIVARADLTPV